MDFHASQRCCFHSFLVCSFSRGLFSIAAADKAYALLFQPKFTIDQLFMLSVVARAKSTDIWLYLSQPTITTTLIYDCCK